MYCKFTHEYWIWYMICKLIFVLDHTKCFRFRSGGQIKQQLQTKAAHFRTISFSLQWIESLILVIWFHFIFASCYFFFLSLSLSLFCIFWFGSFFFVLVRWKQGRIHVKSSRVRVGRGSDREGYQGIQAGVVS